MSERLEEARITLRNYNLTSNIDEKYHLADKFIQLYGENYIEQAERVEELKESKREFMKWWQNEARLADKYMNQNKRYREALESIANEDTYVVTATQIALKALESESE